MMTNPCYPNNVPQNVPIYGVSHQEAIDPNSSSQPTNPTSFLYNLSVLKDKIHEVQSLASIFGQHPESTPIAISTMGTLIQEIIVTASSMMFSCQQMSLGPPAPAFEMHHHRDNKTPPSPARDETFFVDHWYGDSYNNNISNDMMDNNNNNSIETPKTERQSGRDAAETTTTTSSYDLIELDAADLLAKYTHYCQVCSKGFKRDANLRMHMRAHGDEYKSSAALANPAKTTGAGGGAGARARKYYSCPQEGCRWNKKHARFQPLKSMICVKNHYKRSHCPKMYVCNRCSRKQFSVLSDLRTHEKHCGDLKWRCSCGTTFSRKDKLMGHVALFVGHAPAITPGAAAIG